MFRRQPRKNKALDMTQVPTVRGPIDSAQLGTTLMHEHIFVLDTEIVQNYPEENQGAY